MPGSTPEKLIAPLFLQAISNQRWFVKDILGNEPGTEPTGDSLAKDRRLFRKAGKGYQQTIRTAIDHLLTDYWPGIASNGLPDARITMEPADGERQMPSIILQKSMNGQPVVGFRASTERGAYAFVFIEPKDELFDLQADHEYRISFPDLKTSKRPTADMLGALALAADYICRQATTEHQYAPTV